MIANVGEPFDQAMEAFELHSVIPLDPLSSPSWSVVARFGFNSGVPVLKVYKELESSVVLDLRKIKLSQVSPVASMCMVEDYETEQSISSGFTLMFKKEDDRKNFHRVFEEWKNDPNEMSNNFHNKMEPSPLKMYLRYSRRLQYQKSLLCDAESYWTAIYVNYHDFVGRVVVNIDAGCAILAIFAVQAGAKHVYAVEATELAEHARKLIAGNGLQQKITVIKGEIKEVELPEKAEILISNPLGALLVHERMLNSYIVARDRLLIPNGKMFPSIGQICMAPFRDEDLYVEIANKALFWHGQHYGIALSALYESAAQEYFSEPIIGPFNPNILVAAPITHSIDFTTVKEEQLLLIDVPLKYMVYDTVDLGSVVHGIAFWFDVLCSGSAAQAWLLTGPQHPATRWYQVRCVLPQRLSVEPGQELFGQLQMIAHNFDSYIIKLSLSAKRMWGVGGEHGGLVQTVTTQLDLGHACERLFPQPPPPVNQGIQINEEVAENSLI